MKEVSVRELLKRMAYGDESAFAELYAETREDVYRMVAFLIPDSHNAVEVANEVYVQLWKSFRTYDGNRPFRFWLHGIVVRLANSQRRNLWRNFRLYEKQKQTIISTVPPPHESLIQQESQDELFKQIMKLSKKLRTVLVLRYYHDYKIEEIANLLGVPVGTVKSRHHAAVENLRKALVLILDEKVEDSHGYRTTHSEVLAELRPND
jgi:RNA polymerase sigma-70 factor (ECF subfamily)